MTPTIEEKQEMILALKFLFEQWGKDYTDKTHPCYYTAPNTVALLMVRFAASLNRQGWTRVEDAPKDGSEILGYDQDTESIYIVWWNRSMGDGCWNCASNSYIPKISLWMPLPNKPSI